MQGRKTYEEPVAAFVREKISPAERAGFHAYLREVNLNRLVAVAILTLIGEGLLYLVQLQKFLLPGMFPVEIASVGKSAFMLFAIGAALIIRQRGAASGGVSGFLSMVFLGVYLAVQVVLARLEFAFYGTVYSFVVGLLLIAPAFVTPWPVSIGATAVYFAAMAAAVLPMTRDLPADLPSLFLVAGISAAAAVGGCMFYNSHRNGYLTQRELDGALERLRQLTTTDQLTSISNRRGFERDIQILWDSCMRSKTPLAVLMIDVDSFKGYNDHYGNMAGDQCLCDIASSFGSVFQRRSDLFARFGGDEFVVAMQDLGQEEALQQANRFREQVNSMRILHAFSPITAHMTVSIGVASVVPERAETYESLIRCAGHALQKSKAAGGNCVRPYSPDPQNGAASFAQF